MKKYFLIIIFTIIAFVCFCLIQYTNCLSTTWHDIVIGIISATIMGIVIELINFFRDKTTNGYLKGKYKRLIFYNNEGIRQENDSIYKELEVYRTIPLNMDLIYLGNKQYSGNGGYEEGKIEFHFELDSQNKYSGKGRYQYTSKKDGYKMPDFGELKIQVDKEFKKNGKIFVMQTNILPSGIAKSVEIWESTIKKIQHNQKNNFTKKHT